MNADIQQHLPEFFHTYLRRQRAVSPNTIRSYRDTFKLLVAYLGFKHPGRKTLSLKDMDPKTILAFLEHLEDSASGRGNSPSTRNQRLAAIQCFFKYVSLHHPCFEGLARRILAVPMKRVSKKAAESLSPQELDALLAQPPIITSDGFRDLAILLFFYNTGARAQEAADVRLSGVDFQNYTVTIRGKGDKERLNPLWSATIKLLERYRDRHRRKPLPPAVDRFFVNQRGLPFTRFGMRTIVKKYLRLAARICPSIAGKRLSTHSMRHTTAVHLFERRVEENVVKAILGHASVRSSDPYRNTTLQHKRRILEEFGPPHYVVDMLEPKPHEPPEKIVAWLSGLEII